MYLILITLAWIYKAGLMVILNPRIKFSPWPKISMEYKYHAPKHINY